MVLPKKPLDSPEDAGHRKRNVKNYTLREAVFTGRLKFSNFLLNILKRRYEDIPAGIWGQTMMTAGKAACLTAGQSSLATSTKAFMMCDLSTSDPADCARAASGPQPAALTSLFTSWHRATTRGTISRFNLNKMQNNNHFFKHKY